MGGTDDPTNIIELTVEEHAEAHKKLFEQYGKWEDKLAWQGLAGILNKKEHVKQLLSQAGIKSNKIRLENGTHIWLNSDHQREKQIRRFELGTHNFQTSEHIEKIKTLSRNRFLTNNPVYSQINQNKNKIISDNPTKYKLECPHCGKIGPKPQMKQWHFDKCKRKSNVSD